MSTFVITPTERAAAQKKIEEARAPKPPRNVMWSREPHCSAPGFYDTMPPVLRAQIATIQQILAARDVADAAGLTDLADFLGKMADAANKRHHEYMQPDGPDQAHMRKHGLVDDAGKMIASKN